LALIKPPLSFQELLRAELTRILEGYLTGDTVELVNASMTLVKTIAGNDDVKNALYESGLVEIIVEIVNAIDERKGKLKDQSGVSGKKYLLAEIKPRLVEKKILFSREKIPLSRKNPT
jgi:hypothetical protein